VRQELSDAITDYMVLRGSQDFSKRTLANERGILKRFLAVNGNIWVHQINERHATRYFEDAGKTRSARSLQLDHTVLNQFFDWARQTKRLPLDMNPMSGRRRPKTRHRERERIHASKFPHLLDVAGERDPRDRAAIAVLLYTLIRDQEAADLRIGDVDLDAGLLRVRITKSYIEDDMPICAELDAELRNWLSIYAAEAKVPLHAHHFLLPTRQSLGIVRSGYRGLINGHNLVYAPDRKVDRLGRTIVRPTLEAFGLELSDHAGRSKMEGAHTIRRSGARALFDRLAADGYDHSLRIVQSMLHHSSVAITEKYLGVTADRRSRDEILRGKPMYEVSDLDNVVKLSV
jgi:integrase